MKIFTTIADLEQANLKEGQLVVTLENSNGNQNSIAYFRIYDSSTTGGYTLANGNKAIYQEISPVQTGGVQVTPVILSLGQTVVTTPNAVQGSRFEVVGSGTDNGLLLETDDYTVTGTSEITLTRSYPDGTKLVQIIGTDVTGIDLPVVYQSIVQAKQAQLTAGTLVRVPSRGNAEYIVEPSSYTPIAEGYGDHTMDDGKVLRLVHDGEVNVEWFGAKGDGITDDLAPINKALELRSTVVFSGKTYAVSDTVVLQKMGQVLRGVGAVDALLKRVGGSAQPVLSTNNQSNCQVHNIKIDGADVAVGFDILNSYWCTFSNIDVRDSATHAYYLTNSNNNVFLNCQSHYGTGDGIYIDPTSINNNFISGGVEDCGGTKGVDCRGKNNKFDNVWIEWRDGYAKGTETALYINNRGNQVLGGVFKGASGTDILKGIELGASSGHCKVESPEVAFTNTEVTLAGTGLYRSVVTEYAVTNTDKTTRLVSGAEYQEYILMGGSAPQIECNVGNGASGMRLNVLNSPSQIFRLQADGITQYEFRGNALLPQGAGKTVGGASNRFTTVYTDELDVGATTGGTASAGVGNQYVSVKIDGVTYKLLHDGTL